MPVDITTDNQINFLSSNAFRITFGKFPMLTFMANECEMPGIQFGNAMLANPLLDIPIPGDKLIFDPLVITFNVDEYFESYLELYRWMLALGYNRSTDQYKTLNDGELLSSNDEAYTEYSDVSIELLTNKSRPSLRLNFVDAFPQALSPFTMTEKQAEPMPLVCSVTFMYSYFTIGGE